MDQQRMADILTETYQRIRQRLKVGAGKLLADAEAAEDALQDAFVRLWGRYEVRSGREAEALLTRTVRNVSIDQLRKRKTVPLSGDLPEEDVGENREALFRRVEEMVDTELTDLQRLIIRRHEYESVTLEKIAEELGMQPPAVRMQLSRARKTIREQYRKRYHEE
jgi:RNA polymerase sigma-70 factor (ECF subfamily)